MRDFITMYALTALTVVLLAGFAISLILPAENTNLVRFFALTVSLIALLIGLVIGYAFDKGTSGFQFQSRFDLLPEYGLNFTRGLDGLSFLFVLLTLFIFPVCFLAAWNVTKNTKHFFNHLLARELLLVLTFATTNLLCFFIFFESLLIPRFILIGVWGARERKIKAAYFFFLFTLAGSLRRLAAIFSLFSYTGSLDYSVILTFAYTPSAQWWLWIGFFTAFAVKRPLFPFHIWLPEAHVEAPTVGSRLLASLLLKIGGYGFLRFSLTRFPDACLYFSPLVSTLATLGVVYGSLSTIRQIDLKRIIAYSSVAHRNLVRLGLFSRTQAGIAGATYLRLAHGVVSTALFFCVGVLYDRYHSRLIKYYGGLATVRPRFATFFFRFNLANISFPGTSNFLGELRLFVGLYEDNATVLVFAASGVVFSAIYTVWMYNRVAFGPLKNQYIDRFTDINRRECLILRILTLRRVVLGITGSFLLEYRDGPIKAILSAWEPETPALPAETAPI